jgi:multicomponent Na+:H+ antiporter subunit D
VKSCLFLVGGIAERVSGSQHLKEMGGVLDLAPGVGGLFIVAALSLAGMPPFSGFLSKLVLAQAGLAGGNYVVVFVAVVTSFLTLYSMSKIWSYAFWGERRHEKAPTGYRGMMAPTAVLVAFTIVMGLFAQPFLGLATRAAETLTKPDEYIRVVLSAKQNRLAEMPRPSAQVVARAEEGR